LLRRPGAALARFSPEARQFLAYSLLISIAFSVFNLLFNLYMSALGFSNDIIGVFNSLPALVLLGIGLPLAGMADRIGYRIFLLGGGGLAVVGSIVLGLAGQRLVAVLAAGSFALAVTVLEVLSVPLLAQVSSEGERVSLFAVNQSLAWVATLAGDFVGGIIPEAAGRLSHVSSSSAGAIRAAFVVMALLTLAGLPFLVRVARAARVPATVLPVRDMLRVDVPRFARILLPALILGMGAGMYLTFVQLYFAQRFRLTPGPIGLILGVGAALTALSSLTAPAIGRRIGITRTIGVAQLAGFPLILLLAFLMTLPIAVVIFYVRQMVLNLQSPLYQALGMQYVEPGQRARLGTALIIASGIGGSGLGPLLSGFLQVRGGFQLAFSVAAVFYLLSGASFLFLFSRGQLDGGSPATTPGSSSSESITA
jgi:MFS family permease